MPRRARSPEATRNALLDAACELANQSGVFGISVDRVIERAGVSKGGFFHHFPTKQSLLVAVVEAELDRFEALVETCRLRDGSFARGLIRALMEFLKSNATMMASVNAALSFGDDVTEIVVARRGSWLAQLQDELVPPARAQLLAHAIDGVIFSCSMRPTAPSAAEIAKIRRSLLFVLEAAA